MLSLELHTASEVQSGIAARFKAHRLKQNLTQNELAARSGVPLGTLKRFEQAGQIALETLLRLAQTLQLLGEFEQIAAGQPQEVGAMSLDDLLKETKERQRASRKSRQANGL
jgi:transcriptional regulator with XRE-family HTH domain